MGDPKKHRKKFSTPTHPWQKQRLEEEGALIKEYSLKNKKEIWKAKTTIKHYADLAKALVGRTDKEAENEATEFVMRLYKEGILQEGANINDVLSTDAKALLERRLQTIVFRKKLSNSMKQARQFITHGHISVGENKITVPSYIVNREEENLVSYAGNSPLADTEHPERPVIKEEAGEPMEAAESEEKKEKPAKKEKPKKEDKKKAKKKDDKK